MVFIKTRKIIVWSIYWLLCVITLFLSNEAIVFVYKSRVGYYKNKTEPFYDNSKIKIF
jgi:hypothetical protein